LQNLRLTDFYVWYWQARKESYGLMKVVTSVDSPSLTKDAKEI